MKNIIEYNLGEGARVFTACRDAELPCPVVQAHQTHSTVVAYVDHAGITPEELEGVDALITDKPGIAIGARTADCIPVLMYDPVRNAIAAVHSGWRGTVNRIAENAVMKMSQRFRTSPSDICALIGPGISFDSFQVGEEVVTAFKNAGFPMDRIWAFRGPVTKDSMAGGHHIDLQECIRLTLIQCGVEECNIQLCHDDTYTDMRFFSARREGISCGRNINAIMLV